MHKRGEFTKPAQCVKLGDELSIEVNRVEAGIDAIMIDEMPIVGFRFEGQQCLLQMNLFDENDEQVLAVIDSELIYAMGAWDFEFVGRTLTVRSAPSEILVEIDFDPPKIISIRRGIIRYKGVEVRIWPDMTAVVNTANGFAQFTATLHGFSQADGVPVFLGVGDVPKDRWVARRVPNVPRNHFDRTMHMRLINEARKIAKERPR